ncbi:MAG: heme exporter protein CcmB [Burkholderiaceae bacterium]|nr:heme exporter protein CcmB [Roseateles sp.]MBV8470756.1 heme exporter protein CcmB [Burkholderiaceae bacterium]
MARHLLQLLRRELLLGWRRASDILGTAAFFVIVASLFPFGAGPDPVLLRAIAPGVLWTAALLASLLALPRIFSADHADGSLDQLMLSPQPLSLLVVGKVWAHWLMCGLPLVLLAPLLALQFDLDGAAIRTLAWSLLLGTPVLSQIGALGAALVIGARGGSVVLALMVLPLYLPVLVFGAGAVAAAQAGQSADAPLLLLAALCLGSMAATPWAGAAALRISTD